VPVTWTRRAAPYAPLLLRVVVGVVMAAHGYDKLTGEGGPAGFGEGLLAGLGLPAPVLLGWVVTLIELVGGVALVLGVATRLAAVLNVAVLVGAIAFVKLDAGLIAAEGVGYELDLVLIAGLLAVAMLGPSRPSVDHALGVERAEPDAVATDRR
jgi:putative oxidoreductase